MDRHVESSINVNVPIRTAYDQWTQFKEFPRFMEGIKEIRQLDNEHLHWVAQIGGKAMEWDAEITEQVPDQRVAWRSTTGKRNAGMVEFRPISADETEVRVRMEYEPEGAVETIGSFLKLADMRVKGDLKRFKEFIEKRGVETGAWRGEISGGKTKTRQQ